MEDQLSDDTRTVMGPAEEANEFSEFLRGVTKDFYEGQCQGNVNITYGNRTITLEPDGDGRFIHRLFINGVEE